MSAGPRAIFVGAGPGAPDLITLRGAAAIASAGVVIWAASLVNEQIIRDHARPEAEIVDSSVLTLEQVLAIYSRASRERLIVARVHSGDPSLYGAITEQISHCRRIGMPFEIVPGVSSLGAAAAAIERELTLPGVSQSVVITRAAGRTSTLPGGESIASFARHGVTMALFLSAARSEAVQRELLSGGYGAGTPCAVVFRATWPDEKVVRCSLSELAERMRRERIRKTALILVGPALEGAGSRTDLYRAAFSHEFRRACGGEAPGE